MALARRIHKQPWSAGFQALSLPTSFEACFSSSDLQFIVGRGVAAARRIGSSPVGLCAPLCRRQANGLKMNLGLPNWAINVGNHAPPGGFTISRVHRR
jgi:hypothetical protein